MDPDSRRLAVTVTDGRGRRIVDGGLARWLASVAPVRLKSEVAVALVTDARIRQLNRTYRRKDVATDVLSFPAEDVGLTPEPTKASGPAFLGDIVIARGVARRQARDAGHAFGTELRVLALHGFLHLVGYDHDRPDDHGRMARAEARLRRRGGLAAGLIARSATRARRQRPARKKK